MSGFYERIAPFLERNDRILDIGAGTCNLAEILRENGYRVTPIDVQNLSFVDGTKPIIYDGEKIPFRDNYFDTSLILTVLHHTRRPEKIIKEAMRVSRKIIIIEDIYDNIFQKYLVFIMDNVSNLEFTGNPHNNKNDRQWRGIFNRLGLRLREAKYEPFWVFFKSTTYYLERKY